jgi:hypothetical protein
MFRGSDAQVNVAYGRLISPTFEEGSALRLMATSDAEVSLVNGAVMIDVRTGATVGGDPKQGLVPNSLDVIDHPEALENLNFFVLDPNDIPGLYELDRVSAWWPISKKELRSKARKVDCGVRSDESRPQALARYWLSVERLVKEKAATGRDLAFAHEVAEDSRRLASSEKHLERWLLELSRLAGYGARIGQPILLWLLGALIFAVLIRHVTSGICWSCSIDSGVRLWWDLLISPINFIRPVDEASTLTRVVRDDTPARMLSFAARAFGTWMLVSLALAARRYLRTA